MSSKYDPRLRGWLASVQLSVDDAEALLRVPDAVLEAFSKEVLGERVPAGINTWYPEKKASGWLGLYPVGNTGYSTLAAHHMMLSDAVRMDAFAKAIASRVRPGDVSPMLGRALECSR